MINKNFEPDYTHILNAAFNREASRLPLYEHNISISVMEKMLNVPFSQYADQTQKGLEEFYKYYCEFCRTSGYDAVTFECCIGGAMPGGGALGNHIEGVIKNREDFEKYPWNEIADIYFSMYSNHFDALEKVMPQGMKAVGGVGNGIFECVQEVVGYTELCYISQDDPELYRDLFKKVGETNLSIWKRFLARYSDLYAVCRFGDDLGFKNATLIPTEDIKQLVIPEYAAIINEVHKYQKPFLLHSCGCIFDVMDDIIGVAKIDAKHSNEDQIAPFSVWVEKYGDKIGNFGGIDVDVVCRGDRAELKEYITDVIKKCSGHGGFAFGTGNSIPDYMNIDGYTAMLEIVHDARK